MEIYKQLLGHKQGIYCVFEANEGVFTAGGDGAVVLWRWDQLVQSGEPVGELWASVPEPIFCLYIIDERTVLVGTQKGNVYWLQKGEQPRAMKMDAQALYFVRFWKQRWWIGTGSGTLMELDTDLTILRRIKISDQSLRCFDCLGDDAWIGCSDSYIYKLSFPFNQPIERWSANSPSVFGVQVLPGNRLVSVGRDAHIRFFNNQNLEFAIPAHLGAIHGLSAHPQSQWIATSSMDKSIKIWELHVDDQSSSSLVLKKVIHQDKFADKRGHSHSVNGVTWLNHSAFAGFKDNHGVVRFLFSIADDRKAIVWKITEFCEP